MIDDDDDAPPASTQVIRVRKVGETFFVSAGDSESGPFNTRDDALAEARKRAGDRGGLILVEGEGGLDAEAVPPSSSSG